MIGVMVIFTLDLNSQNVPQTVASYLVIGPSGPVLVETGPGSTLATLQRRLADLGYSAHEIKHVLVTHIHFDHAGAAGWWAQQGAQVFVHHVGARHLIDPSRLLASATRIYGDRMGEMWGEMLPAPPGRITTVHDGDIIEVAGLSFTAIDTPGHANHHHAYQLGDIAFVGDVGGVRLPQSPLISLPAPPPEFDLALWQRSVDRLLSESFSAIYPTHFGRLDDVRQHLEALQVLLGEAAGFVRQRMRAGDERDEIVCHYQSWHKQRAIKAGLSPEMSEQYLAASPLAMSVDGMMRYWRKQDSL
jgi:glyoxylase-like metal-dependent hydrolase (beta-lactamase superfamily II)